MTNKQSINFMNNFWAQKQKINQLKMNINYF